MAHGRACGMSSGGLEGWLTGIGGAVLGAVVPRGGSTRGSLRLGRRFPTARDKLVTGIVTVGATSCVAVELVHRGSVAMERWQDERGGRDARGRAGTAHDHPLAFLHTSKALPGVAFGSLFPGLAGGKPGEGGGEALDEEGAETEPWEDNAWEGTDRDREALLVPWEKFPLDEEAALKGGHVRRPGVLLEAEERGLDEHLLAEQLKLENPDAPYLEGAPLVWPPPSAEEEAGATWGGVLGSLLWAMAVALPLGTGGGILKRRRDKSRENKARRRREEGADEPPGTPAAREEERSGVSAEVRRRASATLRDEVGTPSSARAAAAQAGGAIQEAQERVGGEFTVVLSLPCGVTFDESDGRVVVTKVTRGSAGDRAGVAVGDVLVAVSRPDSNTAEGSSGTMDRIAGMPFDVVLDRIVEHDSLGKGPGAVGLTFARPAKEPKRSASSTSAEWTP